MKLQTPNDNEIYQWYSSGRKYKMIRTKSLRGKSKDSNI